MRRVAALTAGCLFLVAAAEPGAAAVAESPRLRIERFEFDHSGEPILSNSRIVVVAGTPTSDGGCRLGVPSLELPPGAAAIQARQVSIDFDTCRARFEIGIPAGSAEPEGSAAESVTVIDRELLGLFPGDAVGAFSANSQTTSTGYWKTWWEDMVHIDVHSVKKWISWSWNGTCVLSASGWTDYWWRSGTGWSKASSGGWIQTSGCSQRSAWADATYRNGLFCWPGTVWSYYDDVKVTGKKDGSMASSTRATWTTYPAGCPPLHVHSELRKTAG